MLNTSNPPRRALAGTWESTKTPNPIATAAASITIAGPVAATASTMAASVFFPALLAER